MIKETISTLREAVDDLVSIISPEFQKKRDYNRFQSELIKREYEAASRGRRMSNWRAQRKHPSLESNVNASIEDRARDLMRNDSYAKRARKVLSTYTIGSGITAAIRDRNGVKDEEKTAVFNKWARSALCDARKRNNFFGLQSLCMREIITAGEVLILKQIIPVDRAKKEIPLALLVVEASYLDAKKDDGVNTIAGVEFKAHAPFRYWIRNTNEPGAKADQESKPVPATDVIHVFEEERPGQVRGISWLAPVVTSLRDLDVYRDAEIQRRKVSAAFVGYVTNTLSDLPEDQKATFAKMEPGSIEFLSPGQDIKFSSPPATPEYAPYTQTEIQKIAAGLGLTYEHLSQNLRDVNFSSARIGQIPFQKFVREWQTQLLVPQMLDPIFEWFRQAAIVGDGPTWADVTVEWTLPRVEMLDEEKETAALASKIRNGLISQSEAIRSIGGDPDRVFTEIDSDNRNLDEKRIVLDTDPRKVTKAGIMQSSFESAGGQTVDA